MFFSIVDAVFRVLVDLVARLHGVLNPGPGIQGSQLLPEYGSHDVAPSNC